MPDSGDSPRPDRKPLFKSLFSSIENVPDGWTPGQDKVLRFMFAGIMVLSAVVLLLAVLVMFQERQWALAAIIFVFFCWILGVLILRKSASWAMILIHFMALAYCTGLAIMLMAGPLRAGLLYLFAFQILTAGFFGRRAAIIAMGLNLSALVAVAIAAAMGYLSWSVPMENRLFVWVSVSISFLFLSGIASFTLVHRNREILSALNGEREANSKLRHETDEREAAVQALKDSEKQYRQLVENINEVVFSLDAQGRFTYVSPRITLVTGLEYRELLNTPFSTLVHPDDREEVDRNLDSARTGEKCSSIFRTNTETQELCWVSAALTPNRDTGVVTDIFGLLKDVTAHKAGQQEKELLENRLAQAQRLEAVGRLAGGIAHDFNNMLSPILGYSEMLLHDFADDKKARESLSEIVVAASRAKDLVRQILIFGSKADDHLRPLELGALVRDTLKLVRASQPASINISTLVGPMRFVVNADPTQLQRVLLNICSNAVHAMKGREGLLEIILELDFLTESKSLSGKNIKPGPYARLTIRDNGQGMTPEIIDKIFEPYFTTKEVGEGAGIGLAVAHSIITNLGGSIQVTSQPEKWTCFCILLPLIESQPIEEQPVSAAPLPMGTGHILLVDDEPSIVDMTRQMLTRLGYEVTVVDNGLEALEILESSQKGFDLVITDLAMPGMTGDKLAMHAKEHHPGLPIILCTGYSETLSGKKAARMGISAILTKPVDMRHMAATVYRFINLK
ncbi:MAG: response regulator [Desulfatibacillum sp.]|nr:response regulator [Desulfatibacillum sp.]